MDFDLSWLLLGLPLAFVLGWLASRLDLRQLRLENRQAPKAYFRGLNFLLNEQQDQAIDAFIEAVQNDPDTQELHFALGNLFRRRGEYQRAVRVHEHLLSRGDLSRADRERAQHALAQDFLQAGLLDRAEAALQKLEGTRYQDEARLALLAIYERSREWSQAAAIARKLDETGQASYATRRAHHLCEQADEQSAQGALDEAARLLREAVAVAPQAPRPAMEVAALQLRQGEPGKALDTLIALAEIAPLALPLYAATLQQASVAAQRTGEALALLQRRYAASPSIDVLEAIIALGGTLGGTLDGALDDALGGAPAEGAAAGSGDTPHPRDGYIAHLAHHPSLVAAARWLAGERFEHEHMHPPVQRVIDQATRPLLRYRCAACGFEAHLYFWHCPGCQAWDSYPPRRVEEL